MILAFQKATGTNSSGGRKAGQKKGPYNISPATKIAASGKRAYTRAINAGQSKKEANAAKKAAEKSLTAKIGGGDVGNG